MKRSTRKSYDRISERFRDAFEGTDKYLQDKSELTSDLKNINFFATQVFEHCFPSDINRLKKIMWFPLIEAALELEYSVFFAKAGIYKVAYMCLRNFMELSLVYFFYVLSAKSRGNAWVKGNVPTPFKREILAVLFENEDFQKFDNDMHIKNAINQIYSDLSDICHTRGQPCSHLNMSRANFPQFIEESLKAFLQKTKDVINIVITCFAGVNPIILFPIPIQENLGWGDLLVVFWKNIKYLFSINYSNQNSYIFC